MSCRRTIVTGTRRPLGGALLAGPRSLGSASRDCARERSTALSPVFWTGKRATVPRPSERPDTPATVRRHAHARVNRGEARAIARRDCQADFRRQKARVIADGEPTAGAIVAACNQYWAKPPVMYTGPRSAAATDTGPTSTATATRRFMAHRVWLVRTCESQAKSKDRSRCGNR